MDFKLMAQEIAERLLMVDGIVITREKIVEKALRDAYAAGINRAALHVSDEVGSSHLYEEILALAATGGTA